jgi:hypothetical protein
MVVARVEKMVVARVEKMVVARVAKMVVARAAEWQWKKGSGIGDMVVAVAEW